MQKGTGHEQITKKNLVLKNTGLPTNSNFQFMEQPFNTNLVLKNDKKSLIHWWYVTPILTKTPLITSIKIITINYLISKLNFCYRIVSKTKRKERNRNWNHMDKQDMLKIATKLELFYFTSS